MRAAGPPHSQSRALRPTPGSEARLCGRGQGLKDVVSWFLPRLADCEQSCHKQPHAGFCVDRSLRVLRADPKECDAGSYGESVWFCEQSPNRLPQWLHRVGLPATPRGRCPGSEFRHSGKYTVVSHGCLSLHLPRDT